LKTARNKAKSLGFLARNRLIFLLQKNIVKQAAGKRYEQWFRFAEKSRNPKNEKTDFEEFQGDDIFEEMMRRLNKGELTKEDMEYIADEQEAWEEVARLERGYYEDGRREGREEGREEGKKEGREEGQLANKYETARKMFSQGYDPDKIAGITELPVEEVKGMQTNEQDKAGIDTL
ncbi:MAG: hypothetical protein GY862_34885, partial [Gammaproteobacteria bacterium]|nr:hypothetical protein [Gammaproteobacteria bacterium]